MRSTREHHIRLSEHVMHWYNFSVHTLHALLGLQNLLLQGLQHYQHFTLKPLLVHILQFVQDVHYCYLQSRRHRRRCVVDFDLQNDKPKHLFVANHAIVRKSSEANFRQINLWSFQLRLFSHHDGECCLVTIVILIDQSAKCINR